jgi:hypothetical protein
VVEAGPGEVRLLTAGCSLEAAEPYGDFLTFAGGHHEIWASWRKIKDSNAALWALVRTFEYEEWPRGRIVFDRVKKRFILYSDRKLMPPETISQIQSKFALPPAKTSVETDFHYQSPETPGPLP